MFRHTMPVRFADVDHAGIVYYPKFFDYFHIAFEELLRHHLGARAYVELLDVDRVGFPSVSAQCEFKSPLRFGDTMDIDLSITRLGARSVTFCYRIYRQRGDGERALAAEGSNTCAVVDLSIFRAIAVPRRLRSLFEPLLEGSSRG
jgi:YbgC/YbaW family acyl-CoA thioester hydrolase